MFILKFNLNQIGKLISEKSKLNYLNEAQLNLNITREIQNKWMDFNIIT